MKRIMILVFASILLILSFVGCQDRRGDILEKMTDQTDAIPNETPVQVYRNMTQEKLEADYQSNRVIYAPTAEGAIFDTPCYYILNKTNYPGGLAYSKLTNSFVTLCRDPFCKHEDNLTCIFSSDTQIGQINIYNERVYYLIFREVEHNTVGYLYSTDFLMNDLRQDYVFPVMVESQYEIIETQMGVQYEYTHKSYMCDLCFYGDTVYYCDFALTDGERIIPTIYTLNFHEGTEATPRLWKTNLFASSCYLDGNTLYWQNEAGEWTFYDLKNERYLTDYQRPSQDIQPAEGYKRGVQLVCEDYSYLTIDHTTEMFKNDPHYKYYTTIYEKSGARPLFQRLGGDIYRVKTDGSDGGVPELIATMTTDGYPDLLYEFYTDGKTLIVKYETYRDFQNEYNQEIVIEGEMDEWLVEMGAYVSPNAFKYAIIDLTTGEIHKPQS